MPLAKYAQTKLEAMVAHVFSRTKAIFYNRFEMAITRTSGEGASWEDQGVNDLPLISCPINDGALSLETIEVKSILNGDQDRDLGVEWKNLAKEIVRESTVAAKEVTFLPIMRAKDFLPSKAWDTPSCWDRIVILCQKHRAKLPADPDLLALNTVLITAKVGTLLVGPFPRSDLASQSRSVYIRTVGH